MKDWSIVFTNMSWSTKQKTFCVETCFANKSYTVMQANFRREFQCRNAPSKSRIFEWVKKFIEHSTVQNLNSKGITDTYSGQKVSARTEMILLYHTVFIPRLIYNCESWSNLSSENYAMLQKSQLTFLRRVMELPRSAPTDALFLEMGIWPIRFEIEFRQLTYLKRIVDRDQNDPVYQQYQEMLKYSSEKN